MLNPNETTIYIYSTYIHTYTYMQGSQEDQAAQGGDIYRRKIDKM